MRTAFSIAAMLMLAGTGAPASAQASDPAQAQSWEIGPIIRGRSRSIGMPLNPTPVRRGWFFDFPYPDVRAGHVHYVTFSHGALLGRRRIIMRYRIDAAPGVRFVPQESPGETATLSLYFQRGGDNWSGRGGYGNFRWYAPSHTVVPVAPGEYEVSASIDGNWTSVNGIRSAAEPQGFGEALAEADRVGFVLGTASRRGHGVYATGPARLTMISFRVI